MKIYIEMPNDASTATFLTAENLALLSTYGDISRNQLDRHLTPEEFADALVDVDVCVCGWGVPKFDDVVLSKANKLKFIAYVAGSVANVVTDTMYERGIRISCGNEGFAESVAEGALAHILASLRRFKEYDCRKVEGYWVPDHYKPERLMEQTVGIVGYGAIARNLLKLLKPFRVKVLLYSNHTTENEAKAMGVQKATLDEIFSSCKVVSLHCAQTPATYHMINDELLSKMPQDALLVNTSRGSVVEEAAMARHVASGHIRVSLDVYEREPLLPDCPLRDLDESLIMQPHLAGPTLDYRPVAARYAIEDIGRLLANEELQNEITHSRSAVMSQKL